MQGAPLTLSKLLKQASPQASDFNQVTETTEVLDNVLTQEHDATGGLRRISIRALLKLLYLLHKSPVLFACSPIVSKGTAHLNLPLCHLQSYQK